MKKVKINKDGFLESIYINDATIEIEVDDELYETLMCCKIGKNWKQENGEFHMVELLDEQVIRERREVECFNLIDNRSPLWWSHLSKERRKELDAWYEAWLVATETKIIPEKPTWLN